ncbi:MAG: type II secretion system protein M [Betaproteobacteria bacterium]|nr:type II secretion system protein M [Betaproteobacteria bacterium]
MGTAIAGFWAERSSRERLVLLVAVTVALAAALYAFVWEPGLAARKSLSETLPRLRAQLEDMRLQRVEIVALRKELEAGSRRGDLGNLLRAAAARTLFAKSVERIDPLPNGGVLVRAAPVSFDAWLDWLEDLQRELGVRLEACRVSALEQPGLVRVEARFAPRSAAAAGSAP